MALKAKQ